MLTGSAQTCSTRRPKLSAWLLAGEPNRRFPNRERGPWLWVPQSTAGFYKMAQGSVETWTGSDDSTYRETNESHSTEQLFADYSAAMGSHPQSNQSQELVSIGMLPDLQLDHENQSHSQAEIADRENGVGQLFRSGFPVQAQAVENLSNL